MNLTPDAFGPVGLIVQALACAGVIARAGYVLSISADRLAQAYGWGRGWAGLALLATVTSLPEMASGLSAVTLIDAPNLAVGNALGACVVNLLLLVVADAIQRDQPMYRSAQAGHLLSAGFGVVMLAFVALSLTAGERAPALVHVGLYSPLLLLMYLVALRNVHAHDRRAQQPSIAPTEPADAGEAASSPGGNVAPSDEPYPAAPPGAPVPPTRSRSEDPALAAARRQHWQSFGLAALAVLLAGLWLPAVADALAQSAGLSRSFMGTVFMAAVTALPEAAVTVSALRLGALDLALGNLLGSNLFNLSLLALDDLAYTQGPLLASVAPEHASTTSTALLMTGLVIVGLVLRPQGRVLRMASWISIGLIAAYAVNAVVALLAAT